MNIPIIFSDEHIVVVEKPINLPVHKNSHMPRDADYLTKLTGMQLNCSVYNTHRLDSKTSGLVVLALSSEVAHQMALLFEQNKISKTYTALVREAPEKEGVFDSPIFDKKRRKKRPAETHFRLLHAVKTAISYRDYENIILSMVELKPKTGRWHQLRQHLGQKRHDIIGDNQHGDRSLNKIIAEETGIDRMFLHANKLEFMHPVTGKEVCYVSEIPLEFNIVMEKYKI